MDEVRIASDQLSVVVARHGAEPQSLRWRPGGSPDAGAGTGSDPAEEHELLWQAGPQWRRHAPVLFPTIGRVVDDEVVVDGERFPMGQHGFARDLDFELLETSPSRVVLRLQESEETRRHWPFPFSLVVSHQVSGASLSVRWTVSTTGDRAMPFSLGWHPAFRWPLVDGAAKEDHRVVFAEDESAPVRRVRATLLTPEPRPSPVQDRVLPLSEDLFADDAVVLEQLASRSLRYSGPGTPVVRLDLEGFPHLGVWSKPTGADLVCLEPWAGLPSPEGWQGEVANKPYSLSVAPGGVCEVGCTVTVEDPA